MKAFAAYAMVVAVSASLGSGAAVAGSNCGMNSNKPCPPEKHSAKEPAYGMNTNKPRAQQASGSDPAARAEVEAKEDKEAKEDNEAAAKASLTGVSASDLKVKQAPPKTSEKENPR